MVNFGVACPPSQPIETSAPTKGKSARDSEARERVRVWKIQLKATEFLLYRALAPYRQNAWARIASCFGTPQANENTAQRVIPYARLSVKGICVYPERPQADADAGLQYFNPYSERKPHRSAGDVSENILLMMDYVPGYGDEAACDGQSACCGCHPAHLSGQDGARRSLLGLNI